MFDDFCTSAGSLLIVCKKCLKVAMGFAQNGLFFFFLNSVCDQDYIDQRRTTITKFISEIFDVKIFIKMQQAELLTKAIVHDDGAMVISSREVRMGLAGGCYNTLPTERGGPGQHLTYGSM